MVATPAVVAAAVRVRLERTREVRHGEGSNLARDTQLLRRLIEGGERRRELAKQKALLHELVGVRVKVADAGKKNLAVDSETAAHLHQLSDLLQLRGERIIGREDGSEWRGGRNGFCKNTGVLVGILADDVVRLNQAEAAFEAEEALCELLPYDALLCAFTTRDARPGCRVTTAKGLVDWPSQKRVSPATEVIMGMEAEEL